MAAEFTYQLTGAGPEYAEQEAQAITVTFLRQISSDVKVRDAIRRQDAELLAQFDELCKQEPRQFDPSGLIEVKSYGAGIDPGTILILVTIVPPVFEHIVAPVAVHVFTSLWDKFILPELEQRFGKVKKVEAK